jgi:HAD superfamily hydrolase (TIGR01549 family)
MPELTSPSAGITTVLFDLDDTLFDHANTARAALAATAAGRASLHAVDLEVLYQQYSEVLEEVHPLVMKGHYTYEEARRLRFQRLVAPYEAHPATPADLALLAEQHYAHYRRLRRPVPGALVLLEALKPNYRIGIVTNNRTAEQEDKLQFLGMSHLVDALITSEEVGVLKPDPQIYEVALHRLHATPAETVMVGDNWQADVVGAAAVGIRPLWLNRFGAVRPLAHVAEITSLEPLAEIYQKITVPSPSVSFA